ncbi:MAG: DUF4091 domain-containing protein [Lentisphaerae bacterium]|mgnify:CR=1 FL=1|jgi:hypothetical protein|nr:DUF4091 domain-containing protein [Lentisphaerota bacterium]MBT5604307.1 DUF4091 domain-containing protein [Lentisphaerota bacterium]MBT7060281.1 DUF4091 domain-containing protein [Lentisphaerota bacterium]MBT7847552.1 DUF4091 domain-containing protein [Lentisphaerota bacterium]
MQRPTSVWLTICTVLMSTLGARGATRFVRPDALGAGDGTSLESAWTIHEASEQARAGDLIGLAKGEYVLDRTIVLRKDQDWAAASGGVVLRPAKAGIRLMEIPANAGGVRLEGIVFSQARLDGAGGAALRIAGKDATIRRCEFVGNHASGGAKEGHGGGAVWVEGGEARFVDCGFTGNDLAARASRQGGAGVQVLKGSAQFDQCRFRGNSVYAPRRESPYHYAGGGAVYVLQGKTNFVECRFESNRAEVSSGNHGGGALYLYAARATLAQCELLDNEARQGHGGGVFQADGEVRLDNCRVESNVSTLDGGAIYQRTRSSLSLVNCKITANRSPAHAISINASWGGTNTHIANSLFRNNLPRDILRSDITNGDSRHKANVTILTSRFESLGQPLNDGPTDNGGEYTVTDSTFGKTDPVEAAQQMAEDLPEPVFFVTFEKGDLKNQAPGRPASARVPAGRQAPPVRRGAGIAGSDCIDYSDLKANIGRYAPLTYDHREMIDAIDGAKSFTISGWIKRPDNRFDGHEQIVWLGDRFGFILHGKQVGRLMALLYETEAGKPRNVAGSYFTPFHSAFLESRWAFFAFSYDGTRKTQNAWFYMADEKTPVRKDHPYRTSSSDAPMGGLKPQGAGEPIILGASDVDGGETFRGLLDSVRIYASKTDDSAALDQMQLEMVRQEDLGKEWLRKVADEGEAARQRRVEQERSIQQSRYPDPIAIQPVDILDNVFPDRPPRPLDEADMRHVPRGAIAPFQFAVRAGRDALCRLSVQPIRNESGVRLRSEPVTYHAQAVPVEGNNGGGGQSSADRAMIPFWGANIIREAPFELAEPLFPAGEVDLEGGRYHSVVVEVLVPRDAEPGIYTGRLVAHASTGMVEAPFSIRVYPVEFDGFALQSIHWLNPEPRALTTDPEPPELWSERHWQLLENAGRVLKRFGDTHMLTPATGPNALVRITRATDGSYVFDFSRLERWFDTFERIGFEYFDGRHIVGAVWTPMLDEASGGTTKLLNDLQMGVHPETMKFLKAYYTALHEALTRRNMISRYFQCQYDEPHDEDRYRALTDLARRCLPGVKTKDAINGKPAHYSPLVDVHVFGIRTMEAAADVVQQRVQQGRDVWEYQCCSPYPPYANRHLDEIMPGNRLYPWYAYLHKADGYLFWAANQYRGVDPYKHSIGPTGGDGYRPVGHPPGDNWMFYPHRDGLYGSMRMLNFREGLLDHAMLVKLAERDRDRADEIMNSIARNQLDYETDPRVYHQARREILEALHRP